ncbi:hypothetical protein RFF57_10370, partial [Streptococcus ruminantium]|nr:hypothetical protein [Streptococcus ruminantium]
MKGEEGERGPVTPELGGRTQDPLKGGGCPRPWGEVGDPSGEVCDNEGDRGPYQFPEGGEFGPRKSGGWQGEIVGPDHTPNLEEGERGPVTPELGGRNEGPLKGEKFPFEAPFCLDGGMCKLPGEEGERGPVTPELGGRTQGPLKGEEGERGPITPELGGRTQGPLKGEEGERGPVTPELGGRTQGPLKGEEGERGP